MKKLSFHQISLFIVCLFVLSINTIAQVSEDWIRRYNGSANSNDYAKKIVITKQGNICVMGSTNEILKSDEYRIITYSPSGDTVSNNNFGQEYYDIPTDFKIDDAGFVYITGYTFANWPTTNIIETMKYSTVNDSFCWGKTISYTSIGRAITTDHSGNVYVTGDSSFGVLTIKYDSVGQAAWWRSFNDLGDNSSNGMDIEVDETGNVYVLVDANDNNGVSDYVIVKYNTNGDTLWIARYDNAGQPDNPIGFVLDEFGNVYVTGTTYNGLEHRTDYATVKYDSNGNEKWVAIYDGPNNSTDEVSAIILGDSANVYVTGTSNGYYGTVKYNTNGEQQWVAQYAGFNDLHDTQASAITLDSKGSVYVTGRTVTNTIGNIATVKYDLNGNYIWDIISSGDSMPTRASSIAVDTAGNVYITGNVDDTQGQWSDWITLKYTQSPTGVKEDNSFGDQPVSYSLNQNYPNPFNPSTKISWQSPIGSWQTLKVFDVLGNEVVKLVDEYKPAGSYEVGFNPASSIKNLASGIYFYQLKAGEFIQTKKMILIK
jgi:hypothetical protein